VVGDWNGDGKTDAGVVYDWGWGLGWYLDANGNGAWDGCGVDRCFFFGGAGSKPVVGDWNGDGKTDAGVVYDWGWGLGWYLDANGNGAWDGCGVDWCFFFGSSGYVPVVGDWNGDGSDNFGVYYPASGAWYLDGNGNGRWEGCGVDWCFFFGGSGYVPVAGDWNGDRSDNFGVYYPASGAWYLDGNGNGTWEGCGVDWCPSFGGSGYVPVVGDWPFGTTITTILLNEDFSGGIPATWTVVNGGSGSDTWTTTNPCNRSIGSPFASPWAMVDSDCAWITPTQDEQLITPSLNASSCTQVVLEFSNQFQWYSGGLNEVADVDVSVDGGTTWTNVLRMQGASDGYPTPNTKTVDITAQAAGHSNVKIRFHYYNANFEWWWAIDNVKVVCF
jgi:hypothetical protein